MFKLKDTFNDCTISRHKTVDAAAKAHIAHDRAVKRHNGKDSYIPTVCLDSDNIPVDLDVWDEAVAKVRA